MNSIQFNQFIDHFYSPLLNDLTSHSWPILGQEFGLYGYLNNFEVACKRQTLYKFCEMMVLLSKWNYSYWVRSCLKKVWQFSTLERKSGS